MEAGEVSKTLKLIREELGYDNAKAFFRDYLSERTRLDFNYTYYMKIEGAKVVPSPAVINVISSALETSASERLILSYCQTLFPKRASLFKRKQLKAVVPQSSGSISAQNSQRFLNDRQIAVVAKTKEHYFIFMILTLAREPISKSALESHVKGANVAAVLSDLIQAKLVRQDNELLSSISNEMRFPEATSPAQKAVYSRLDLWNLEFDRGMNFKPVLQKMHLRRVSALSECDHRSLLPDL